MRSRALLELVGKVSGTIIVAMLASSCASVGASKTAHSDFGCNLTPETARQLSRTACQSAAGAGIALCTPPGPVGMGAMVCESAANGVTMQEMAIDPASMAENGVATQTISAPIVMPNGEVAAIAACAINRRHNSVVYAVLTRGPTSKDEADYLRDQGSCSD
jgi:hypothetical protein